MSGMSSKTGVGGVKRSMPKAVAHTAHGPARAMAQTRGPQPRGGGVPRLILNAGMTKE